MYVLSINSQLPIAVTGSGLARVFVNAEPLPRSCPFWVTKFYGFPMKVGFLLISFFLFFFSFLILKSLILTCVEASLPNCVRGPTD